MSFPKFSDKLEKVLTNKSALNEFKDIKNIVGLLKLSKKYNLGLENIKFSKEKIQTLQKDFPKLGIKNFFDDEIAKHNYKTIKETKIINFDNKPIKSKKTVAIEKLADTLSKNKGTIEENPKNILQNLLKNIDKDSKKITIKTKEEDKKEKVSKFIKKDEKIVVKNGNKIEIPTKKMEKNDIKIVTKGTEKNDVKTVTRGTEKNYVKTGAKKIEKSDIVHSLNKKDIAIVQKETKLDKNKRTKDTTEQIVTRKETDKTLLQTKLKTRNLASNNSQTEKNSISNSIQNIFTTAKDTDNSKKDIKEIRQEPNLHKAEIKTTLKSSKNANAKQSLNQFSNNLKEKIEAYKPPIMKLQMTLTPKNLGEVEVTILNRGHNLHVNITSNTNTMSLFTQNQAEFKNSLVNMGFTNLEMTFSDQGKNNQQNQNQNSKKTNNTPLEETRNQENHESTIELIVPKYV
ncbi:MAG: flagellar hook-length control protein FliK [Epsilonproteobacteria bacterium]|nr:flagellar hook-length control protein FliK [Campylobacterota bacterium]